MSFFQAADDSGVFLGGERLAGSEIRAENVLAVQTIANIVKTSLGPVGLDKMLVDNLGVSLSLSFSCSLFLPSSFYLSLSSSYSPCLTVSLTHSLSLARSFVRSLARRT